MRTAEYNNLSGFSNSFLSRVKDIIMGKEPFRGSPAAIFGEALHQMILEPHLYQPVAFKSFRQSDFSKLEKMKQAIEKNRLWVHTRDKEGETEKQVIWKDEQTGLVCKGILDRIVGNDVMDIKTTSATSLDEFMHHITKYEYERQAAMYLDATDSDYFTWVCLSKRNYATFNYTLHRNDPLIESGRKKYRFLLGKCQQFGIAPNDGIEVIKNKVVIT